MKVCNSVIVKCVQANLWDFHAFYSNKALFKFELIKNLFSFHTHVIVVIPKITTTLYKKKSWVNYEVVDGSENAKHLKQIFSFLWDVPSFPEII